MKKNIIAFTFFLFFNISFCQTIEKDEINGTWKVEKNLTKTSDSRFKDLIEGFQTSTFGFEENGNFE